MHHCIPDAHEAAIIATFHANFKTPRMLLKLSTKPVKTVTTFFELADKVARAEEAIMPINNKSGSGKNQSSEDNGNCKRMHHSVFAMEETGAGSK